jgi:ABC-type transport system involved in multi-copper enzyme maturation permease subunit
MDHIWLITKITFKDAVRSRVLFGITILAALLFSANVVITNLFSLEVGKVMIDLAFGALTLAGLSVIFFLGIGHLSQDIHNKTVYMIISRPVTRSQYILGKFGGMTLLLLVIMLLLGLLALVSFSVGCMLMPGSGVPRNFSWLTLFAVLGFRLLSLLVILSFAFFFTIVSSSMYLAMLFSFCIYFIGNSIETIVKVLVKGEFVEASPLYVIFMKGVSWIFPNLSAFDLKANLAYGLPYEGAYLAWTGLYGVVYTSIMLMLTLMIFKTKDIC